MVSILAFLRNHPVRRIVTGEMLIEQGDSTGQLYVLIEGMVEVTKDDVKVATANDPGAIFGDLAALLGVPHTAAVRAVEDSSFHVVADAREFLEQHPPVSLHLCKVLARRLDAVNTYLVDAKRRAGGPDPVALVDGRLDKLIHREPRAAPPASTLRDPDSAE